MRNNCGVLFVSVHLEELKKKNKVMEVATLFFFFCFLVLEAACNTSPNVVCPGSPMSIRKTRKHQPNEPQNLSTQTIPPGDLKQAYRTESRKKKRKTEQGTMLFNALVIQSSAGEDVVYDSTNQVFHCGGQTIVVTHSVSCRWMPCQQCH